MTTTRETIIANPELHAAYLVGVACAQEPVLRRTHRIPTTGEQVRELFVQGYAQDRDAASFAAAAEVLLCTPDQWTTSDPSAIGTCVALGASLSLAARKGT